MVPRLISVCAPPRPRSRKRGYPKIRYFSVPKGCSTVDRRSRAGQYVINGTVQILDATPGPGQNADGVIQFVVFAKELTVSKG